MPLGSNLQESFIFGPWNWQILLLSMFLVNVSKKNLKTPCNHVKILTYRFKYELKNVKKEKKIEKTIQTSVP